ncbi:MAG: hypothetical protein EOP88_14100 [Verrucomicrobiaceae bacterium]|nr:MAG: hypothetical protein EOP88_14100 [Verrucomicrobiaceae bacterium]
MNASNWLWNEIHGFFETDDGSLPEIRINHANSQAVVSGFAFLRSLPASASQEPFSFWSLTDDAERPVDSVPNAAALVVSGDAQPFHMIISGIRMCNVTLPDLGVFIFPDQLALDYRMGSHWDGTKVEVLFRLVAELLAQDPGASLSLEVLPPDVEKARFHEAWNRFIHECP